MIEIMAGQAALALQSAELYADADRALDARLAELATLQEVDRQINAKAAAMDLCHAMETVLDCAMHTTLATAGTIALSEDPQALAMTDVRSGLDDGMSSVDPHPQQSSAHGQQTLRVVAHRGYPAVMAKYWDIPWPADQGLAGHVVQTGETVLIDDVTQDTSKAYDTPTPRSHLAIPIRRDTQVIGVIGLESTVPGGFTADHLGFVTRLADRAAIAIEIDRLTQVWVSLLGAAHRYTLNGEPIRVWAQQHDEQGTQPNGRDWILCAVEHSGTALTPEEQVRVFEPFYELQRAGGASAVDNRSSSGLELAAARSIVELYGGRIWVESKEGRGNTFYFSVPTRYS